MTILELYQALQEFTRQNAGNAAMQPFFEAVRQLALIGMNVQQGGCIAASGELSVLAYIKNRSSWSVLRRQTIFSQTSIQLQPSAAQTITAATLPPKYASQ